MAQIIHKNLATGRWFNLSLMEQLANVGSEIHRALNWKERNDDNESLKALERGLELVDLTLDDPRWKHRLKEITRAREIICDYFYGRNEYKTTPKFLENYFFNLTYAARKDK